MKNAVLWLIVLGMGNTATAALVSLSIKTPPIGNPGEYPPHTEFTTIVVHTDTPLLSLNAVVFNSNGGPILEAKNLRYRLECLGNIISLQMKLWFRLLLIPLC